MKPASYAGLVNLLRYPLAGFAVAGCLLRRDSACRLARGAVSAGANGTQQLARSRSLREKYRLAAVACSETDYPTAFFKGSEDRCMDGRRA